MANEIKLAAQSRTEFGKGAARRIRRDDRVPAVMYGHGTDPVHISLPGHETLLALRTANALLSISIDGAKAQLALPKQVQRDPIRGFLEHIDLVVVRKGEKVTVEVPVVLLGADAKGDRLLTQEKMSLMLECEATHIPADIEIDVTGLEVGEHIAVADITLPEGASFAGDPAEVIVAASQAKSQEQLDAELSTDEPAEAPAEADSDEA